MAYYKTRDYNMLNVIRGATKAGVHRDIPKHTDKYACRGNPTMYAARKEMPYDIVTEWRRPAEHGGDEVFDIYAQHNDGSFLITKVILIDEDGSEGIFNVASFSDDEIVSIEAALALEWDSNHIP